MSASAKKAIPVEPEEMGWKTLKIKEFAHTTSGGTPKSTVAKYYGGDIPWVKSGDLNDGQLHECESTITELGLQNSSAKLFKPGTVLIALYGATIGRLALLQFEAATNQAVCGISLPDNVDNKYLFYFLLSIRKKLIDQGKGGAQPNISQHVVREIEVPIAPFEKQKQIVAKIEELFSHIDAGIDALKQSKQLLNQYRQSVLKAAVTGELSKEWREQNKDKLEPASKLLERILHERRQKWEAQQLEQFKAKGKVPKDEGWKGKYKEPSAPDTSDLLELPEGWCWASVVQLCFVVSGQTPKGIEIIGSVGEIPWFKVGDMNAVGNEEIIKNSETKLTIEAARKLGLHVQPKGTIIFPKRGGAIATNKKRILGQPSAYDLNTMGITPIGNSDAFIWHWFLSIDLGSLGDGSNVPQINHGDIEPIAVPLPSLDEQIFIAFEASRRLASIAEIEKSIDSELQRSERLKQSVLQSAFGGELK